MLGGDHFNKAAGLQLQGDWATLDGKRVLPENLRSLFPAQEIPMDLMIILLLCILQGHAWSCRLDGPSVRAPRIGENQHGI